MKNPKLFKSALTFKVIEEQSLRIGEQSLRIGEQSFEAIISKKQRTRNYKNFEYNAMAPN